MGMSSLHVVNELLTRDPEDRIYALMVEAMTEDELAEAMTEETRPEGLKRLHAEAAGRGIDLSEAEFDDLIIRQGDDTYIFRTPIDEPGSKPTQTDQGVHLVPIEQIYPNPHNPRKRFDQSELDKLTDSVRQVGILSPILVVRDDEQYRIVAGERRYRAAKAAGLAEVPVLIRELTPEQEFEAMLTENIQRADLDPIEEAQAFAEARKRGYKQVELAEKLGISQSQVANRLRLLKLPPEIQDNISREIISAGHGLALIKVAHLPKAAKEIVDTITLKNTPVAKTGEEVNTYIAQIGKPLYPDTWNPPKFDYEEICIKTKCKMQVSGKHSWEPEERPYCMDAECWEKHQTEAEQEQKEQRIREALGEAEAVRRARAEQKTAAEEAFEQEKRDLIENPNFLDSEMGVFMVAKTIQLSELFTDIDVKKMVCERLEIDIDAIEGSSKGRVYEEIVKALRKLFASSGQSVDTESKITLLTCHLYEFLFEILLYPVRKGDYIYQLTLGMSRKNEQMEEIA